jgi:hypothetical protein
VAEAGLRTSNSLHASFRAIVLRRCRCKGVVVAKQKQLRAEAEITVWPSSMPEDIGSIAPSEGGLSCECDELGSRFLSGAVEQGHSGHPHWEDEIDEPYFDAQVGRELLRSFGLTPTRNRTTTRPLPHKTKKLPSLAQPKLPQDFEEFMAPPSDELDVTEENMREASLLDHEAEEAGEVESPKLRTEDVHTHAKRRGGHARTSLRPPRLKR